MYKANWEITDGAGRIAYFPTPLFFQVHVEEPQSV